MSSAFSGWVVWVWLPHSVQKLFTQPSSGGRQDPTSDSPAVTLKLPGTVSALTENAVPVRRGQRWQGQYGARSGGSVPSNRPPPHMPPPVSGSLIPTSLRESRGAIRRGTDRSDPRLELGG